jgi:hypothetical protein
MKIPINIETYLGYNKSVIFQFFQAINVALYETISGFNVIKRVCNLCSMPSQKSIQSINSSAIIFSFSNNTLNICLALINCFPPFITTNTNPINKTTIQIQQDNITKIKIIVIVSLLLIYINIIKKIKNLE